MGFGMSIGLSSLYSILFSTYMHNKRIDIGSRYLGAVAIATERLLDLGAVHSMTLEESIQLGVVLLGIDRMPICFVVTQEELRHVLAVSYKESNQLMVSCI